MIRNMLERKLITLKQKIQKSWIKTPIAINWRWKLVFILVFAFLFHQNNYSVQVSFGKTKSTDPPSNTASLFPPSLSPNFQDIELHNIPNPATAFGAALSQTEKTTAKHYSNLDNLSKDTKIIKKKNKYSRSKRQKCLDYIDKYAKTAQEEAVIYHVPASITLAQALLESNAGESRLARNENNHFGIKCKKKCLGCRCANYKDDSKYDMFRVFDTPWRSYREHSKLLTSNRYMHLLRLPVTDYKSWARGLQKAGYATNQMYGDKLIQIIESFELNKYD